MSMNVGRNNDNSQIPFQLSVRKMKGFAAVISPTQLSQINRDVTAPMRPSSATPDKPIINQQKALEHVWGGSIKSTPTINSEYASKLSIIDNCAKAVAPHSPTPGGAEKTKPESEAAVHHHHHHHHPTDDDTEIPSSAAQPKPVLTKSNSGLFQVLQNSKESLSAKASALNQSAKSTYAGVRDGIDIKIAMQNISNETDKQIDKLQAKTPKTPEDTEALLRLKTLKDTIATNPTYVKSKIFENQSEPLFKSFGEVKFLSHLVRSEKLLDEMADSGIPGHKLSDSELIGLVGYLTSDEKAMHASLRKLSEKGEIDPGMKNYIDAKNSAMAKAPENFLAVDLQRQLRELGTIEHLQGNDKELLGRLTHLHNTMQTTEGTNYINDMVSQHMDDPVFQLLGPTNFISYLLMSNKNVEASGDEAAIAAQQKMTPTEQVALYGYTTGDFRRLNGSLRAGANGEIIDPKMQAYIDSAVSGMKKLPPLPPDAQLSRVIFNHPKKVGISDDKMAEEAWKKDNLQIDGIYADPAFASSTLLAGDNKPGNGAYILNFLNSSHARNIGPFSAFPGEAEYLILPGTKYKVISVNEVSFNNFGVIEKRAGNTYTLEVMEPEI